MEMFFSFLKGAALVAIPCTVIAVAACVIAGRCDDGNDND